MRFGVTEARRLRGRYYIEEREGLWWLVGVRRGARGIQRMWRYYARYAAGRLTDRLACLRPDGEQARQAGVV